MKKSIHLPEVEKTHADVVGPDTESSRVMFGTKFYPIVYYAPETGECVVSYPHMLESRQVLQIIDMAIAGLVRARQDHE